jgi:hypothetical protein
MIIRPMSAICVFQYGTLMTLISQIGTDERLEILF